MSPETHQHIHIFTDGISFFLYYVFFGIGMQGVPWLYPTEINSLAMRTKGAAIGTATNWIFNFMGMSIQMASSNESSTDDACSCRDHSNRHSESPMEVLYSLDSAQRVIRAPHVFVSLLIRSPK